MLQRTKRLLAGSVAALSLSLGPVALAQGNHGNFYDGARSGGRGGSYSHDSYRDGHNNRYDRGQYQGHGVGAGRGALIGGGIGAVAGAVFGGGLKGALIAGGAGAGIGALAGHEHQENMKHRYYDRRRGGYYYR